MKKSLKAIKNQYKNERLWICEGLGQSLNAVLANSKSEARAKLKKMFGFKDRLPIGVKITDGRKFNEL
jgi:hypothetical protein